MKNRIDDPVFGEMEYAHGWQKTDQGKVKFCGNEFAVKVVAQAYAGDEVLQTQRDSYRAFLEEQDQVLEDHADVLIDYCESLNNADAPRTKEELCGRLTPTDVLFLQDGSWGILFDCTWDIEHGVGLFKIKGKWSAGPQDAFL